MSPAPRRRTGASSAKAEETEKEKETAAAKAKEAEEAKAKAEEEKKAKKEAEEKARAEEAEKARKAKIDAGDLIVSDGWDYEASTKDSKSFDRTKAMIDQLKGSKIPLTVQEMADANDVKYPEDYMTVFMALEHEGLARRFEARESDANGAGRAQVAYLYTG